MPELTQTDISIVAKTAESVRREVGKAVVGQDQVIEQILAVLFADGHVLLEGVPGVAKTLMARAIAQALSAEFKRVQFTPDLMPSDLIGTNVFNPAKGEFALRRGPIFTNLLLADEINRTPPKTQSALLEAMEERRVTIDGEPNALPELFMVIATQNPIEYEGTYPLPEAQLDRFMVKVLIDYPSHEEEQEILARYNAGVRILRLEEVGLQAVADQNTVVACRRAAAAVRVYEPVRNYIGQIVQKTRSDHNLVLGGSPRAAITLMLLSKALAAMRGRDFVIPDDVKELAPSVLRHRLILKPEAEIEGLTPDRVVASILAAVQVPR